MLNKSLVIALFDQHAQAEKAVEELQRAGFDMKRLSIVGKEYQTEENVVGYYTTGKRMKVWGKNGAFWGGIWGLLFGSAFFMIPGIGPLVVGGPIIAAIVGALEGAVVVGGVSFVGAGLCSIGIPKNSVLQYETSLKAGKFMLLVHGTPDEVVRAKAILSNLGASETQLHLADAPVEAIA
ncbi:MAG TPA: general stress protein [Tepidisphaeraceae bacterium]|nr:general stress protein [Tepidisphaeraceae bacterium]